MKAVVAALLVLASFASAEIQQNAIPEHTAYGYLMNYGVPEAERIRKAEEKYLAETRIVGGVPAGTGQYPFQVGLLISLIGFDGTGVCGGSLISSSRVATAAHCWTDGVNQAWRFTVVLGSVLLFTGGTRVDTSAVVMHPNWLPQLARNDIAVAYLPNAVPLSSTISPIALPSGSDLNNDFAGVSVIATGFGRTFDGAPISVNQYLSHVRLNVITNSICSFAFPLLIQPTNICASGVGGVGTCNGDSGGPLIATNSSNQQILVGVTSFGHVIGCEAALPSVFARVTSFTGFLNQHIN